MKTAQKKEGSRLQETFGLYRKPKAFLAAKIQAHTTGIQIATLMVVGMGLSSYFSQLFSLGKSYPVGKIVAGILILGPILGLLFFLLAALFAFWIANFFDRTSVPNWISKRYLPPFPLKNLLFKRIISETSLQKVFNLPPFKQYQQIWSWIRSCLNYCQARIGKGPIGFGLLFSLLNRIAEPIFGASILLGTSLFWGNDQFLVFEGGFFSILLFFVQTIAIFASLWFWSLSLKLSYHLSGGRAWIFSIASFCFALLSLLALVHFFIGIRLF